jgi:hypothetical protein
MSQILFATNSYQSPSLPLSAQRCVNLYLETEPPDAKTQTPLFGSPGLTAFATCGQGPIRGAHVMGGTPYFVSGAGLYSLSAAGAATLLGTGIAGAGVVAMADNGTQLCIVDGVTTGLGYLYAGAALGPITNPYYSTSGGVTYFDQYFVFWVPGTSPGNFYVSNAGDGTQGTALAFGLATVQSGAIQNIVENHELLLVFTTKVIESWYDAGSYPFPFQRYDGATIERGCAAGATVIKDDNTVFWLGDDKIFYRLAGVTPQRISTHAIEAAWRKYATVADAFSQNYTIDGHKCIVVTFPTANATWVCDISANHRWHERESWNGQNQTLYRWRANAIVPAFDGVYVGDAFTGQVGLLDPTTFTEYGNTIRGLAISPPVHQDRKRVWHSLFELDMETGVGLAAGQGSNPQIMLDHSDDGGRTYSTLQKWRSMGKQGDYLTRVRWTRMGLARQRVYRIQITDPVKRTILAAHLTSEVREH